MHARTLSRSPRHLSWPATLLCWLLALGWLVSPALALAEEPFLQPDQAFRISGEAVDGETLLVRWAIEPGYYLYRSKFRFDSKTPDISVGQVRLPPGETKQDEFFGEVEIYRDAVTTRLPLTRTDASNEPLVVRIEALSQGCADAGFCYPPQKQQILLELPPATVATDLPEQRLAAVEPAANASRSSGRTLGQTLGQSLGQSLGLEDDIPAAEEAFRLHVRVEDPQLLRLTWQIAPNTYLYQEGIALLLEGAEDVQLGEFTLPDPEIKPDTVRPDGSFGDVAIYQGELNLAVPLLRGAPEATEITLVASFQGCHERGICYPPLTERIPLALPAATRTQALTPPTTPALAVPAATPGLAPATAPGLAPERVSESDQIAERLARTGIGGAMAIFFVLGLLLAFTPCVFPMVPILSGIIAGQGKELTTLKAFWLSLAYVLAMALTYAIIGVIAGLFGANLQAAFQSAWVLGAFAAVFVALALSMFGFYDLQLPSSLQTRLTLLSNRQQGGTLAGAAIMGALSAIIVGPCVAPPLMGALIFIGQTGDAVLGFFALLGLGLGMGAPLLAIGTSAGRLLPRAGAWMDAIKAVFGVLLLAVAILLIERVLPAALAMLLWGLLLIAAGVYLGALTQLALDSSGWRKLWKALGLALLVYGVLMLVGAAAGGRDTLQPLRGLMPAGGGGVAHAAFRRIKTLEDLDREVAAASAAGRPVMLDFYADWCAECKKLERDTFPEPAVIAAMERFVLLQADVTANDADDRALLQERFGLPGPPVMLFFDTDGVERRGWRLIGFVPPQTLAAHLRGFP